MNFKQAIIIIVCISYIVNEFLNITLFNTFLSIATIIVLMIAIASASKTPKIIGIIILCFGIGFSFYNKIDFTTIIDSFQNNLPIIVLILLAPLMVLPLQLSDHIATIKSLLKQYQFNEGIAYKAIYLFMFVITPILNLASIRIIDDIVIKDHLSEKSLAKAYIGGFLTSLVWSPYFASVIIVLHMLNVPVRQYIFIGFLFALIQIIIAFTVYRPNNGETQSNNKKINIDINSRKKIISLIMLIIALIIILVVLEYVTKLPMMLLVSLSSVIIPIIFALITHKWKETIKEVKKFISRLNYTNNEIAIFLSAGFMASVLSETNYSNILSPIFETVASYSIILFSLMIIFIAMLFALIGLHQIIVIPLLIIQISPDTIGMSEVSMAFLFILAWGVSLSVSPISVANVLVSGMLRQPWYRVGLIWNGLHILILIIIGLVFVGILQMMYI